MNSLHIRQTSKAIAILCFVLVLLTGCSSTSNDDQKPSQLISTTVPFTHCEDEFPSSNLTEVPLYFVPEGSLPYIDVTTYLTLIDPMSTIDPSDIKTSGRNVIISYDPVPKQYMFFVDTQEQQANPSYRQTMSIDFGTDMVTVSSYLFFLYQGQQLVDEDSDFITIVDAEPTSGQSVTIPFGQYGFDFLVYEEEDTTQYLLPFHVASLLFTNSTLYRTYYNGDQIIGGGRCINDDWVTDSSLNGKDIPTDIREASYNLFTLSLDYFSPIKQVRNVDSYQNKFVSSLTRLETAASEEYYTELTKLLYQLDDLHAAIPQAGFYSAHPEEPLPEYPVWFRPIRNQYFSIRQYNYAKMMSLYPSLDFSSWSQLLADDTIAVIHIYQFDDQMITEVEGFLNELPPTVTDVVIDLKMNGGGQVSSIFQLLGLMTDEPIVFTNQVALDGSNVQYTVEVEKDAYDYDWYIQTSYVSYSAAHITALLAKENNLAVLLGEDTSGGASAIEWILLPCGFTHTISGLYTYYSDTGTSELGTSVDVYMEDIWDETELISIID